MTRTPSQCAHCGKWRLKEVGAVNRAARLGAPLYCGKECSGVARRSCKTVEQRREEKAAYDARRRIELRDGLKAKKAAYRKRTYDPVQAAAARRLKMPKHLEYCRRPEYRRWKRDYDRKYRAEKDYGELAECFLLVMDIRQECLSQLSDYEIRQSKGTLNKRQRRKRDYERTLRQEPEVGSLGNLELRQGRQDGSLPGRQRGLAGPRDPADHEHAAPRRAASEATSRRRRHHIRGDVTAPAIDKAEGCHG